MNSEQVTINNGMKAESNLIYSLIPLDEFKTVLGIDDRDDKLARFCLVTGTFTIEQYCKRRFLRKKYFEQIEYIGDLLLPLREYPVISINSEQVTMNNGERLDPSFFRVVPDCGSNMDFPYSIELSPNVQRYRPFSSIKAVYWAGYSKGCVPADLGAACWYDRKYQGGG
jgi:hypothetical protein